RARLLQGAVPKARRGFPAELIFAADQFVITPAGRFEEAARAHAAGDEVRTVIAGYHWFTDWGRDTMISLEGLTLLTGRWLEAGYQLTWMDAKIDDWVVTPRRGKAVEVNALWYNALCLLANWLRDTGEETSAKRYDKWAEKARASFNKRFWFGDGGYLYDVVDCDNQPNTFDISCRPNQLFAISLDHPVLNPERWRSVVEIAEKKMVTPVGLRSLSPDDPNYKPIYGGDLRSRDGAYHQG